MWPILALGHSTEECLKDFAFLMWNDGTNVLVPMRLSVTAKAMSCGPSLFNGYYRKTHGLRCLDYPSVCHWNDRGVLHERQWAASVLCLPEERSVSTVAFPMLSAERWWALWLGWAAEPTQSPEGSVSVWTLLSDIYFTCQDGKLGKVFT